MAYIRSRLTPVALGVVVWSRIVFALDARLDISQYAHDAWTIRSGLIKGNIYSIAQTPDGYLWLGGEFGLFRFDGVRSVPWQPPPGQQLPDKYVGALLVTRDGALWIGTTGLVTWTGGRLTLHPQLDGQTVAALIEDREGAVWAGILWDDIHRHALCAIRAGSTECYGERSAFGDFVLALYEDGAGSLWAGGQSRLWRWKPGPPTSYATPPPHISALTSADTGGLLMAINGQGLRQLVGDKVKSYPVRSATDPNRLLADREINSNKLLRDRDGGLWIGTVEHGLIHVHQGRTDVFSRADGLSGDVVLSLFEDREGNIWVATTGGLDRFRELPVTTISAKQGLSSDATNSVLATADRSIWVATHDGLFRWKNGQSTIFGKSSGLPSDSIESLFQDDSGRIWVFTAAGLAYFKDGRFVASPALRSGEVYSITGDRSGNLWLSEHQGLVHLRDGRLVERFAWSELGRHQQAKVALADQGGVWLSFWTDGGVLYFKDGRIRASYTAAEGLGKGHVPDLRLDRDGALWAATEDGGLSRIKDGRIATLTTKSGLPCDAVHWSKEDDDGSLWLYTGCGVVRIAGTELNAWIGDPKHRIESTIWNAADGVRLRSTSATQYGPPVAKSADGKLWFVMGEGVQVVDPRHLPTNNIPPPVHIERIVADDKPYAVTSGMRLPANIRDVRIDYTALSLVAPEQVHFKYKMKGQDADWKEVVNHREARYTNLPPGPYRFRVMASNNSGVWNNTGDSVEFSIAPAFYQTYWFYALCAAAGVALLGAGYLFRVRQLHRDVKRLQDVIEIIPAMAWTALPDGSNPFISRRWLEYTGVPAEDKDGFGWTAAVAPEDRQTYSEKWRTALADGEPFEAEVRFRCAATGEYRWFLNRAVPLRDEHGKVKRWYGAITDIEDRKRAEQEREKLRVAEDNLRHLNRISTMGALVISLAHDINQPITAVVTSAKACLRWLDRDPPSIDRARAAATRIEKDGTRAGETIARLRAFYKKGAPPRPELLDVNDVAREMIDLLHGEAIRFSIVTRTDFATELPHVRADRVQLQQVFMNLMLNAIESMHDTSGELIIRTQFTQNCEVLISVSDTGVGLPDEQIDHIFTPFFTTKEQGTGMGLAISRSIIESHGGRLWASSNNGQGASFHFTLPVKSEF